MEKLLKEEGIKREEIGKIKKRNLINKELEKVQRIQQAMFREVVKGRATKLQRNLKGGGELKQEQEMDIRRKGEKEFGIEIKEVE